MDLNLEYLTDTNKSHYIILHISTIVAIK